MVLRICHISDTHNAHQKVQIPECNVLIHSGDATVSSTLPELQAFATWFNHLPVKHKIYIPGNHDWMLLNYQYDKLKKIFNDTVDLVIVDTVEVDEVKIFGASPPGSWSAIPEGIDILVTHYPPLSILDEIPANSKFNSEPYPINIGSKELLDRVTKVKPRFHLFGHIHECGGCRETYEGTVFSNAAMMDENYQLANQPFVFDIERKND